MDYTKEREILLETIKSQQETIRKLTDVIAAKDSIRIVPYPTVPYQPINPYNPLTSPIYTSPNTITCMVDGDELLDSTDKERMLNGDRTD